MPCSAAWSVLRLQRCLWRFWHRPGPPRSKRLQRPTRQQPYPPWHPPQCLPGRRPENRSHYQWPHRPPAVDRSIPTCLRARLLLVLAETVPLTPDPARKCLSLGEPIRQDLRRSVPWPAAWWKLDSWKSPLEMLMRRAWTSTVHTQCPLRGAASAAGRTTCRTARIIRFTIFFIATCFRYFWAAA